MRTIIAGLGTLAALTSAIFWLLASIHPLPENIDTMIADLQAISRLNAYGAWGAVVFSLCNVALFVRKIIRHY